MHEVAESTGLQNSGHAWGERTVQPDGLLPDGLRQAAGWFAAEGVASGTLFEVGCGLRGYRSPN